jgi:DhnA family fructose-bisphosphate aldolase class Ia
VPVLIAGGLKMETVEDTLRLVQDATRAGAAGVVFGRNIWQSGDTRGTVQALSNISHEDQPATQAASAIQQTP